MTELARFAMRYSVPILLRNRNEKWAPSIPGSGGGLLVSIGGLPRLITVEHVLSEYREQYARDAATLFEVGGQAINPKRRLLYAEATTDLAVLDLAEFVPQARHQDLPPSEFFVPQPWPGNDVAVGDRIVLGGWPGAYRVVSDGGMDVYLGYDSIINVPITGTSEHEFQVRFDRKAWSSLVTDSSKKPNDYVNDKGLGGHSGTPVFRISPIGERPELVGFVKQYGESYDSLTCIPVTKLRSDGSIKSSSIGYVPATE